jgi:hypothetical protein
MDDNLNEPNEPIEVPQKKKIHKNRAWFPLILILAGVILLVQNLNIANFNFNWWALFIFIPVFASLSSAWDHLQASGRFTSSVLNNIGSAIVVGTVAVILMFGMNWTRVWPLMVIAGGLSMFITGLSALDPRENKRLSVWMGMSAWIGLAAIVLGLGFLVKFLPITPLLPYITMANWWAIPIIVAGCGILLNALVFIVRNQWKMNWESWSLLLVAVFGLAVGILALFSFDWNLLFPIVLIACGVMILAGIFRKR